MRLGRALSGGTLVLVAMALVTGALAQPRGRTKPKPKPPAPAVADAGAEAPPETTAPAPTAPAPAPAAADAGPVPPPPRADIGDGGVKPSPLNPAPNELPPPSTGPAPGSADVDKLIGDISALRARVAAVSDTLFHSRIAIGVRLDGDHAKVARFTVSLDDGVVYASPPNFRADDLTTLYDHGVAPGRHAVTVDIDRKDDRDETFRTSQRSRFVVDVPKDERLVLEIRVDDDSTMAADFPSDRSGRYDLRVRAKASSKPAGK